MGSPRRWLYLTDTAHADEGPAPKSVLAEMRDSLVAVFRNPNLRRIQVAFAGSAIGDWAYATAVAVWAFGEGGARRSASSPPSVSR